jgi:hypothetical protein
LARRKKEGDKMTNADKIQRVMNILSSLTPRVDQVSTIAQPIALCVNELCDVRDDLKKQQAASTETDKH